MKVKAALLKVGGGTYKKWQEARSVLDIDLLLYPSPIWASKKELEEVGSRETLGMPAALHFGIERCVSFPGV